MSRPRKGVLTYRKEIARDMKKTLEANSPGGRYYRPTLRDKIMAAREGKK